MPMTNAAERRESACADDCEACARPRIYRRPRAPQVQAKANIVLIKLNYERKEKSKYEEGDA